MLGQVCEAIFYISEEFTFGGIKFFWTIEDAGNFLGGGKFMPESLFWAYTFYSNIALRSLTEVVFSSPSSAPYEFIQVIYYYKKTFIFSE